MPYIFSTHPCSGNFTKYKDIPEGVKGFTPRETERTLLIKGGAGIYDEKLGHAPAVIETFVNDEELVFLKSLKHFNDQVDQGFLTVMNDNKVSAEEVSKGMEKKNKSLPMDEKNMRLKKKGSGESVVYEMESVEEREARSQENK